MILQHAEERRSNGGWRVGRGLLGLQIVIFTFFFLKVFAEMSFMLT